MFFALENLRSGNAFPVEKPWEYESKAPYELEKADFVVWEQRTDTVHRFLKGVEGLVPGLRVDESNPPSHLHALIADYDGMAPDNPLDLLIKRAPKDCILPEWIGISRGRKPRLIWTYESPIAVTGKEHGTQLQKVIGAQVKASKMFAELDPASFDMTTYFEIGREWMRVPGGKPIPTILLNWWDYEMFSRMQQKVKRSYNIPFDKIAEEVELRWPGRVAKFAPREHCLRFWAPESDNKTGCMIYEGGVRVYVPHDKPFMTWADIFGKNFVDSWQAEKYGDLVSNCYWDTTKKQFWTHWEDDNSFHDWDVNGFKGKLATMGILDIRGKGEDSSPANTLMTSIRDRNRVSAAMHYLWHKPGVVVKDNGQRILNITTLRPSEPGAPLCAPKLPWENTDVRKAFPFIHRLLTCMFLNETEFQAVCRGDDEPNWQLRYLLAWMASYYQRSYNYQPCQGPALFLCGPTGKGKTLFSRVVMSTLMRGFTNAAPYFTGAQDWTNDLLDVGVLSIDDDEGALTSRVRTTFQSRVKQYVANASIYMNGKWMANGTVPLLNRLVVTLNEDLISRQILPPLDNNSHDKISFLQCGNARFDLFGDILEENAMRIRQEMPAFARWLIEHEIPVDLRSKRFGVISKHHDDLLSAAMMQGDVSVVLEALESVMKGMDKPFEGRIRELHALLSLESKEIEMRISTNSLQNKLAQLSKSGYDIELLMDPKTGMRTYKIPPDVITKGPKFNKDKE